ncbi:hypothetical protein BUALT_Bualt12G0005000 [Buddleja alternifolia]|uniref:WRC domain-containing protein n=1 Tax=Buddleja alternifolia TaxID=168488 RepID=A0AAV6WMS6_9LAMI|nr:hypothetical protein BUALT_Bualt12G0005000 [Buddleja alternifolia]
MRIRKRLASSSSIPTTTPTLLDPHRSDVAPLPSDQPSHHQPSDHIMAIRRWVFSQNDNTTTQKEFGEDETWRSVEEIKSTSNHDIREIVRIFSEEENIDKIMQPSSSSAQGNNNYEVVPFKKRKGSFPRINPNEAKMKSKTNKKCGDHDHNNMKLDHEDTFKEKKYGMNKKSKRGNVIMEGSRCSRVNGRGWRCCHPTLVGYSLCEHHLGKGRLRSMSNVRSQDEASGGGGGAPPLSGDSGGGEDSRKQPQPQPQPFVFTKKRTKVGVVKARSMSSLLRQI